MVQPPQQLVKALSHLSDLNGMSSSLSLSLRRGGEGGSGGEAVEGESGEKREATRLISWYSGVSRISCPSSEFVIFVFFDEIRKAWAWAWAWVGESGDEEEGVGARQRVLFIVGFLSSTLASVSQKVSSQSVPISGKSQNHF